MKQATREEMQELSRRLHAIASQIPDRPDHNNYLIQAHSYVHWAGSFLEEWARLDQEIEDSRR